MSTATMTARAADTPGAGETPKAVVTTLKRAETLFADGYSINPTQTAGAFIVTTPERFDKKTGELYTIDYTVDIAAGTCNCEQNQRYHVCKHCQAARKAVEQARAALAEATRLLNIPAPAPEPAAPLAQATPAIPWRRCTGCGRAITGPCAHCAAPPTRPASTPTPAPVQAAGIDQRARMRRDFD